MTIYLNVAEIKAVHVAVMALFGGGGPGIRDLNGLEAAVNRPQSGYYANLTKEAAALLESLLINHPFVDGNKRVAFAACDVFLRLNGRHIHGKTTRLYQLVMGWIAAAPADRFARISAELREVVCDLP